jgi:hypothetical protein
MMPTPYCVAVTAEDARHLVATLIAARATSPWGR